MSWCPVAQHAPFPSSPSSPIVWSCAGAAARNSGRAYHDGRLVVAWRMSTLCLLAAVVGVLPGHTGRLPGSGTLRRIYCTQWGVLQRTLRPPQLWYTGNLQAWYGKTESLRAGRYCCGPRALCGGDAGPARWWWCHHAPPHSPPVPSLGRKVHPIPARSLGGRSLAHARRGCRFGLCTTSAECTGVVRGARSS